MSCSSTHTTSLTDDINKALKTLKENEPDKVMIDIVEKTYLHMKSFKDNHDLLIAFLCGLRATVVLREGWRQLSLSSDGDPTQHLNIEEKGFGDLVSDLDVQVDKIILSTLKAHAPPTDLIVSEELAPELSGCSKRVWIIDPLDGTVGFLFRASPEFSSTLIALQQGDSVESMRTSVALVWFPNVNSIFYAQRGRGEAYENGEAFNVPLYAQKIPLQSAWIDLNQYSDVAFENEAFAKLRTQLRVKGKGAGLVTSYPAHSGIACHIAKGAKKLVNVIVHDNNRKSMKQGPWDVAAPQLVLEEAGGIFLNGKTGKPYRALIDIDIIVASSSIDLASTICKMIALD